VKPLSPPAAQVPRRGNPGRRPAGATHIKSLRAPLVLIRAPGAQDSERATPSELPELRARQQVRARSARADHGAPRRGRAPPPPAARCTPLAVRARRPTRPGGAARPGPGAGAGAAGRLPAPAPRRRGPLTGPPRTIAHARPQEMPSRKRPCELESASSGENRCGRRAGGDSASSGARAAGAAAPAMAAAARQGCGGGVAAAGAASDTAGRAVRR